MHPSSYDRMAEFCRDYLTPRQNEPLTIVDLGSCDYNGSYRPIFQQKKWRYIGADLGPGPNVDLVLRDPYRWRELKTASVDVLVSGQTFEHTEFLWETMLEIARVLKPNGLCCIIAPATGNEHRFPLDCWRIFTDGFRALARYSYLEVLHSHTHWKEAANYDSESNKWHESILIARKPLESLDAKIRRHLFAFARRWLHPLPPNLETLVQVFYASAGIHREEDSVVAGVEQRGWREVMVTLPTGAEACPLRIDFMRTLEFVDLKEVRVTTRTKQWFCAHTPAEFDQLVVAGDAERMPHPNFLRIRITGPDPQLYLPALAVDATGEKLRVGMRLRIFDG
jgi:SAM-dependent methyltransferase